MALNRQLAALAATLMLAACGGSDHDSGPDEPPAPTPAPERLAYPASPTIEAGDTYFGRYVADPYRWLEDIRGDSTAAWVREQNHFTDEYLAALPEHAAISARVAQLFGSAQPQARARQQGTRNDGRYLVDGVQGTDGRFYYQYKTRREHERRRPGTSQLTSTDAVIYVADGPGQVAQGRPLVDLNQYRIDPDDHIELTGHQISADGNYLVYVMTRNFSDLGELHVVDLAAAQGGPVTVIANIHPQFVLAEDSIIYSRPLNVTDPHVSPFAEQALFQRTLDGAERELYRGPLNSSVDPALVLDRQLYFVTFDSKNAGVMRLDLEAAQPRAQVILKDDQFSYELIDGQSTGNGHQLLVTTTQGSARKRLIEVNPDQPAPAQWRELLPLSAPGSTEYVEKVMACDGHYYAELLDQGASRLIHIQEGTTSRREVALPGLGALDVLECLPGEAGMQTVYGFSSLSTPWTNYEYDPQTGQSTLLYSYADQWRQRGFDADDYTMRRLFATSRDGTQVPVFLAHRKGLEPQGEAPTYIYVYGGFDVPITPAFDPRASLLLENDGIYVVAQVRGGGELGNAWHDAGRLLNKQNTYDDVAAVAEHLIEQGYTRASRLGLGGESNGGLTTAAVSLQRPDLFAAVFPGVGVLDLVRYDLFTNGFSWHSDYGRNTVQAEFDNLMQFSPLHRVQARAYPPSLVLTGQTDGRVLPSHSYKYVATLQNTALGPNPYLLRAFPKSGHGLDQYRAQMAAQTWAFFFHHTDTPYPRKAP